MKPHIRVLGIDDGPFTFQDKRALFAGVLMRLPAYIEGISIDSVEVDGYDSAERISGMLERNGWSGLAHAILIDGASLGGFNIVDTEWLYGKIGIPVITVSSERPDMESIKQALKGHFSEWEERYRVLESREMHEISVEEGTVWASFSGTDLRGAKEIIRKSIVRGLTPEAVRVAHIFVRALKNSEVLHEIER